MLDVATGKAKKIVTDEYGRYVRAVGSSWSPDNKWVTYTAETPAHISRVFVYSLEQDKSFPITDGKSDASEPAFDAGGKYLYFISSDSTGMSKHGFSQSASDARPPRYSVFLAVLQKDTPSPFLKESDEEKGPQASPFPRPKSDEPKTDDKPAEPKEPKKDDVNKNPNPKKEPAKFAIDFDGIDQRILALPVPSGNYGNLQAVRPVRCSWCRGRKVAAGAAPAGRAAATCCGSTSTAAR